MLLLVNCQVRIFDNRNSCVWPFFYFYFFVIGRFYGYLEVHFFYMFFVIIVWFSRLFSGHSDNTDVIYYVFISRFKAYFVRKSAQSCRIIMTWIFHDKSMMPFRSHVTVIKLITKNKQTYNSLEVLWNCVKWALS